MKRQILSEEFKRMQKLAGINEGEGVASDGGYYTKPERGIVVSREEASKLFDYHEETGMLPDDMTKEDYDKLMSHYGIKRDNNNFTDPAGGSGIYSHI